MFKTAFGSVHSIEGRMRSHSVLQMRADWIRLLEAMHADDPDAAWIEAIVAAAKPVFPRAMAVGFYSLSYNPNTLTPQERAPIDAGRNVMPMVDGIALVAHPMPGTISVLHALYDESFRLTPYERRVLTRIALHLDAAHRIRLRPESVKGELTFDGRILGRNDDAPAATALEEHAIRVTESRTNRRRRDPDSLELWSALLDGRVSLAPRGSGL
jgi:hypothetical protein